MLRIFEEFGGFGGVQTWFRDVEVASSNLVAPTFW